MNLPEPHQASKEQIAHTLNHLCGLLINLPKGLPIGSKYDAFKSFRLDPNLLNKTRDEVAAMGEQLESVFGWSTWTTGDGILNISKWGTGIQAIQPILAEFFEKYLENAVLKKWIIDMTHGAEKAFTNHGLDVSCNTYCAKQLMNLLNWALYRSQTSLSKLWLTQQRPE